MKQIWKFPLKLADEQLIAMPSDAECLHVAMQHDNDKPCLWAIVEPVKGKVNRLIFCVGTGNPMPVGPIDYLGTTQHDGGTLIFHWFEPSRAPSVLQGEPR